MYNYINSFSSNILYYNRRIIFNIIFSINILKGCSKVVKKQKNNNNQNINVNKY